MSEELVKAAELCSWLRDHSSGAYRPSAEAADLIESLLFRVQPGTATLPAAPAPTGKAALQALVDQAQELNMGYGEAPTEQASGLPPLPKGHRADEYTGSTLVYGYSEMRQVQQDAYALAARQAPSDPYQLDDDDEVKFPNDANVAIIHTERYRELRKIEEDVVARPAPDSRDALRKLLKTETARDTLRKLADGQGTETEDGKVWLAAKLIAQEQAQ